MAYTTNFPECTISVLDMATNTVVATVPVGDVGGSVAVHLAGIFVYAANEDNNTVSVINTATHTVSATVPVAVAP